MGMHTLHEKKILFMFAILCILLIATNLIDNTHDFNLFEFDDVTLERVDGGGRLSDVKSLMKTVLNSSASVQHLRDKNQNRTNPSHRDGGRKEGMIPKKKSRKEPETKPNLDNKLEDKSSIKEDTNESARRQQLEQTNPLFSEWVINPHPFHFINNSGNCSQYVPGGEVFLLILVACRPEEERDRRWIRDTWGSIKAYKGKTLLTRFLVARSPKKIYTRKLIWEESVLYGDIIQENFADTYRNMTHKVLMGLKWAAQMCPRATYVMKLDSDMFVNVFRLVDLLEASPRSNFAIGHLKGPTLPQRTRTRRVISKWYTPIEMYPESTFPPYLNGPAYVMSGDLPGRIFNQSVHARYLPWDDVYIGIVMTRLGVQMKYGHHFEDYPIGWNGVAVLKSILNGIASYVGHQRAFNFVLRDIWLQILAQYDNYVYSPPPDSLQRFNNKSLRHW
ncbi:beta-1,3-galactosyltransferase 1-like [Acanthaster planci]|uniref:Hexosyltransferase n=1 Tax=Acanthaster planci TaxID=133434 RepID=A0A8B7YP39_ACAPL|nr:beta-1,3-galactosyltransferase 1-like [Acanthaster planci]